MAPALPGRSWLLALLLLAPVLRAEVPAAVGAAPDSPALPADALLTRIGFASCLHQARPQPILEAVNARPWDLFLMIGDNVYGDAEPPELAALAEAYALQARSPGLNALRASTPVLAVWDDHDYGQNDAGGEFPARARAEELFHAFWHTPADAAERGRPGLYRSRTVGPEGRRVQLIFLDTRSFRSPLVPTDARGEPGRERYLPNEDPEATVLGDEQWAWLEATLQEPAELRLLVSSIQVIADGHGWEAWRLFPKEREKLYALLGRVRPGGVVVLSGDRHRAGVYRYAENLPYPLLEVTSSSLNLPIRNATEEAGPYRLGATFLGENFGEVVVDWEREALALRVLDLEGQAVRELTLPLAALEPRASGG